jgi:zinc/manganese transport system substrate-binding protein
VAELIKQIKADGVHTWFMENQLDPRLVKQIASATGAQPGGELYPEALSKKGAWRTHTSKRFATMLKPSPTA